MVNPAEAGLILRGNVRLSEPLSVDSDPAAEVEQRLSEVPPVLALKEDGLGIPGPPGCTPGRVGDRDARERMLGNRHLRHVVESNTREHGKPSTGWQGERRVVRGTTPGRSLQCPSLDDPRKGKRPSVWWG